MYLLDTDTLTHLHAGQPRVIARLRELVDPDVGTTIITKIELLRGRHDFLLKAATGDELLRAQRWLARTEELLAQVLIGLSTPWPQPSSTTCAMRRTYERSVAQTC
jgi:tRNA(fMet)-specific endonuclease VapC